MAEWARDGELPAWLRQFRVAPDRNRGNDADQRLPLSQITGDDMSALTQAAQASAWSPLMPLQLVPLSARPVSGLRTVVRGPVGKAEVEQRSETVFAIRRAVAVAIVGPVVPVGHSGCRTHIACRHGDRTDTGHRLYSACRSHTRRSTCCSRKFLFVGPLASSALDIPANALSRPEPVLCPLASFCQTVLIRHLHIVGGAYLPPVSIPVHPHRRLRHDRPSTTGPLELPFEHGLPLIVQPMKLLPMIFPLLVGAHSKLVPLALDHVSHWSPYFSRTSFCQFTTASAMAEPRPSSSFVLVKGRNLPLPEAVTVLSLQTVLRARGLDRCTGDQQRRACCRHHQKSCG